MNKREARMIAAFEARNTHTCGNCRRWAYSAFQAGDPNKAVCAWPHTILVRPKDPKPVEIPEGVEIQHKETWRDGGRNCAGFLRDKDPHETPDNNKVIP